MKSIYIATLTFSLLITGFSVYAQDMGSQVYLPTVESLSQRETPQWFNDAKLGIFIHWGLYSVPAWATPTTTPDKVTDWKAFYKSNPYAEWYLNSLRISGSPTQQYHEKKYGKNFDYYAFRDSLLLQTKGWKADDWAEIIQQTGAKYVVLTTKHHDGFTLYPSNIINPFRTKEEINSPRDYVGELSKAVREKNIKFGVYYSGGLDWTFNYSSITNLWPDLFQSMPTSIAYTVYADCQLHELIHKYKPDVLWNDVNYPANGDLLGIFSELFNTNPDAVVNDRWQQYEELTDFSTPEYTVRNSISEDKWETCRGLGYSFGYNQVEGDAQLLSSADLIKLLVEVVSKNGNLLLNIGPKGDGTIPDNQLQRLRDLGNWMQMNGEGIYGTTPWEISDAILNDGTKLCFTRKDGDLYVFVMGQPKNGFISLPFIQHNSESKAILFGNGNEILPISLTDKTVKIQLPEKLDFEFAMMIKITNT